MKVSANRSRKYYYSPLRYPGGKTSLFPLFDRVVKDNGLQGATYVEPFAGGAGAALALLILEKVDRIVINDLDRAIYSFWASAVFNAEELIERLQTTPVTIEEWHKQRATYKDPNSTVLDLGFAAFFLNRTNVSGIIDGGPIGGLRQNGKWKIDARFNKSSLADRITQLSAYKDRISVLNRDGIELVRDYLKKENTLVYLDPPYYEKGATLYLNHYAIDDHKKLAGLLNANPGAFWLLTYDNKQEIWSLYPERTIITYALSYNARKARIGQEILILSDALQA